MAENTNYIGILVDKIMDRLKELLIVLQDIKNSIIKIPDLLSRIRHDLNNRISELKQAQAQIEIFKKMAQLKSKKSLIIAENEAINEFKKQLEEDFKEIDDRYGKINNDLEEECKNRIREIDGHLLEIPDKFPYEMQSNINDKILPLFNDLIEDTDISYSERITALKIASEKTRVVIKNFIEERNNFFEQVKKFEITGKNNQIEDYYLPLWIVEGEKEGQKYRKTYLPGNFKKDKISGIKELPEIKTYHELNFIDHDKNSEKIMNSFNWEIDYSKKEKLIKDFRKFFNKVNDNDYASAGEAVIKSIQNSKIRSIK